METVIILFVVCCGLILGSFFNVLIWRLPRHESIVKPSSHCPKCNRPVRPWENIPVASFIALRGKCAGCGQKISLQYPLVELTAAGAALLLWYAFAGLRLTDYFHNAHLILQCLALLVMIPVTVIDLRHRVIPDAITLPLLGFSLCASFLPGDTTPFQSFAGAIAGGGTLVAMGWLGKIIFRKGEAMGGGDVKLLAAAGALWGPKIALLTIFFGAAAGTLAAAALAAFRRIPEDRRIPFGPFLAVGLWVAVLWGDLLVESYMKLAGMLMCGG
ncbi:MAG: prepilin peptidase [Chitinispirillaceae bacterium]|nr:prepilin peptidase [Chitinispirillaceae bacterium]